MGWPRARSSLRLGSVDFRAKLKTLGRAFKHRNYRLFFIGQAISLIGTWLTRVAMSWLIYRLTNSVWLLGVVGFCSQAPTFFFAPIAGVLIDRLPRKHVLLTTQALAMLQSGLLAYFALRGTIGVTHIIVLATFQGLVDVFDMPARQTFLSEIVDDRADLPNAVALNSSSVNVARLLGPSLAGVLIALVDEGTCFAIDAVSYVAVLASLVAVQVNRTLAPAKHGRVLREMADGFTYVARFPPIRALLLLLMTLSFAGMPYTVLMPAIARKVLHGDASTLGALMAASGAGALVGALLLATRSTVLGLGRLVALSSIGFGVALMLLSRAHVLVLAMPVMALSGLSMMIEMASTNTLLQTISDEERRGRVMSFYAMAVFGTTPFGSLLAGTLADRIGADDTLLIGGALCVLAALAFARALPELKAHVRPIYRRLGILPELAHGVAVASQISTVPPA
jgi:MFS family permease